MKLQIFVLIAACVCVASAGIPKKLFKKYAMKKVMESCFGEQVLSDLKSEVVAACDKCQGEEGPVLPMIRERLQAMLVGTELSPRPARFAKNSGLYIQFHPVTEGERRWRRDSHDGESHHEKFGPAKIAKLMKMRRRITAMVGNVTCVMQEMNMLTADNQVNYDSIKERIAGMPLPEGLVADLTSSVEECHQFSSCLPESIFEKSPVAAGFGRQIAFFKCMKMAKLEACMKQDFRERFMPEMMKEEMEMDSEEGFQTVITSALLEDENEL